MSSLDFLGKKIAEEQDKILPSLNYIDAVKAQLCFDLSKYPRKKRSPAIVTAVGLAVAVAAAMVVFVLTPSAITLEVDGIGVAVKSWISSPHSRNTRLAFSDGSQIRLASDSSIRVEDLHADGAYLLVERGKMDARIVHQKNTDWRLYIGPYLISVVGTRFKTRWDPETRELFVKMLEGSVRVEGPMVPSGTTLSGGERLYASLSDKHLQISTDKEMVTDSEADMSGRRNRVASETPFSDTEAVLPEERAATPVPSGFSKRAPGAVRPTWKTLVQQGNFVDAALWAQRYGADAMFDSASAVALLNLGDAARHIGEQGLAVRFYKAVRRRFPKTAHASDAAFALGKIAFDGRSAFGEAAKWFRACLADSRTGVLDREALGRLMESLKMSGDAAGAASAAGQYLRRFPDGPHAPLARKLNSGAELTR